MGASFYPLRAAQNRVVNSSFQRGMAGWIVEGGVHKTSRTGSGLPPSGADTPLYYTEIPIGGLAYQDLPYGDLGEYALPDQVFNTVSPTSRPTRSGMTPRPARPAT